MKIGIGKLISISSHISFATMGFFWSMRMPLIAGSTRYVTAAKLMISILSNITLAFFAMMSDNAVPPPEAAAPTAPVLIQ
jgi:hypothetical protein